MDVSGSAGAPRRGAPAEPETSNSIFPLPAADAAASAAGRGIGGIGASLRDAGVLSTKSAPTPRPAPAAAGAGNPK